MKLTRLLFWRKEKFDVVVTLVNTRRTKHLRKEFDPQIAKHYKYKITLDPWTYIEVDMRRKR